MVPHRFSKQERSSLFADANDMRGFRPSRSSSFCSLRPPRSGQYNQVLHQSTQDVSDVSGLSGELLHKSQADWPSKMRRYVQEIMSG